MNLHKYPFINGRDCKILVPPIFIDLPRTNFANVPENIDNWIEKGETSMLDSFCRTPEQDKDLPESTKRHLRYHNGYRFISSSDLDQKLETTQEVSGVTIKCLWSRKVHYSDHFCPLWFSQLHLSLYFTIGDSEKVIDWKSDNQLKTEIKNYKNGVGR